MREAGSVKCMISFVRDMHSAHSTRYGQDRTLEMVGMMRRHAGFGDMAGGITIMTTMMDDCIHCTYTVLYGLGQNNQLDEAGRTKCIDLGRSCGSTSPALRIAISVLSFSHSL